MVIFDKDKHTYINSNNKEEYISATTLINKYKEPFDVEKFSKLVSLRKGVSQDTIKETWDKIKKDACDFGSSIHTLIEEYFIDNKNNNHPVVLNFLKHFNKSDYHNIKNEHILFDHEFSIAGTADIIADVNEKVFDIVDIKTNKKIREKSLYNKFFLTPLLHLSDCEISTYSLQLSLYAYMYSNISNKQLRNMYILWFNKDNNDFIKIPITYLKNDILNMLRHYNENYRRGNFRKLTGIKS